MIPDRGNVTVKDTKYKKHDLFGEYGRPRAHIGDNREVRLEGQAGALCMCCHGEGVF